MSVVSAFLTNAGLWLAEKLGAKFFQRLWRKICEKIAGKPAPVVSQQPETKVKLPSGVEVTFRGERAPGVYLNDGVGKFLATPIPTPTGLPEVVEAKQLMESGDSEKAEKKIRELLSQPAPAVKAPSEEQAFLAALRLLDEGDSKFHADDFAGAEKVYREAGEMAAKSGNELLQSLCLNALGAAVGSQDRDEEALHLVEEALVLDPDSAEAWCNKGAALLGLERYVEAIPCFDEAIRLEPDYAMAWGNKGTALLGLERHEEAIPCFDEAIRLKPDFAEAWGNKGTALLGLERYEEAIPCFDETINLKPYDVTGWHNKGTALVLLERYEEAIPCFDEALKLDPNYGRAWAIRGMALFPLDQSEEAKKSFDKALPLREQLPDKGVLLFDVWTFLILTEALASITSNDMEEAKERALELAKLRKEAEKENMVQVVDGSIAQFKEGLSKRDLKRFRKFEAVLEEAKSRDQTNCCHRRTAQCGQVHPV